MHQVQQLSFIDSAVNKAKLDSPLMEPTLHLGREVSLG